MQDSRHNPEGYLDLTAYAVLEETPQSGEIWTYERKPGKLVEVLVVRNHGTVATSLILVHTCYDDCVPVRIGRGNTRRFTNPQMLSFVLTRNLRECVARLTDAEFAEIRGTVKKTIFPDHKKGGQQE